MSPTSEQIEVAAYHRWQRRGGLHGLDRDDWIAAEKDLVYALNYRDLVRYKLNDPSGVATLLGKAETERARRPRHCRYCELSEPSTTFRSTHLAVPSILGNTSLIAWDECDECRARYDEQLAGAFETFARPFLDAEPVWPRTTVPAPALKALVRMALGVMPAAELHHFDDAIEWVMNPDHGRDAGLLGTLGCHAYRPALPIASPFAALARRADDDAPWPYMLFFLGAAHVVFQIHVPLCIRDEDLVDESGLRGPELSMSVGAGSELRASPCAYLPVEPVGRGRHLGATTAGAVHKPA